MNESDSFGVSNLCLMNEIEFMLEFIYVKIVFCFSKECYAFKREFGLEVSLNEKCEI